MRNNETGEFELVVGNKQLLSGFFIVVLLFAVAFAMGYVVGQNTQRPAKMASEGTGSGAVANTAADSRPQPSTPVPAPAPAQTPENATGQPTRRRSLPRSLHKDRSRPTRKDPWRLRTRAWSRRPTWRRGRTGR